MRAFRTAVVALILTAMFSPAAPALAKTEPATPPVAAQPVTETTVALVNAAAAAANALTGEAARYAQREQQSRDLQNFKGGAVYVYFGSGLVLVLVIILLILII